MRKIAVTILCCLLLAGMILPMGVSANGTPEGLDQNLVIHYDFEGETPEEQMRDKAPAGVSSEQLSLISTVDENTQEPLSYVKDGVAHVDHALNNYLNIGFSQENNIGKDVWDCAENGEITTFIALKVSGSPQAWATALDFDDIVRLILKGSAGNTAIFSTMGVRGTTSMNFNANVDFVMKNGDIYHDTDVLYLAVTYQYNAETKKLVGTVYHSFDYGKTYTETVALFEEVDSFITESSHICFGKTRAGNQFKKTDHGTSYDFYDFRVYNKALSLDEIKSIQTGHEMAVTPDDPSNGTDDPIDEPDYEDTTPEATTASTTAAVTTTAAASHGGNTQEKSGCKSTVSLGTLSVLGVAALGGVALKRRKRKE